MNKAKDSSANSRQNYPALRILLILIGLILLERAFVWFLLPSQNPIFLGLYSGSKFAAILTCILSGSILALGAKRILAMTPSSWGQGLQTLDSILIQCGHKIERLRPIRLFVTLSILAGIIGLVIHPYIMGDLAFQLWSTHLRDLGFTDKLNVIPMPTLTDLSQSFEKHITQKFPPGIPWIIGYLLQIGLDMDDAVYLLGVAAFLSGGIACLKILHTLRFAPAVQVAMAVILTTTCFSRPGLSFLTVGGCDVFSFGLLPWGIYFALTAYQEENVKGLGQHTLIPKKAVVAATLLGIVYLLKYSQFVYACASAFFLCTSCLINAARHRKIVAGLFAAAVLSIIFLIPFAVLTKHQRDNAQGDAITYTEHGVLNDSPLIQQRYGPLYEESSRGWTLLATLPAAPGWLNLSSGGTFSELVVWCRHFTPIAKWFEGKMKINGNVALSAILGLLGSWLIFRCGRGHYRQAHSPHKFFLLSLAIIPPFLLAYESNILGYNFLLSHENRFGIPVFLIVEALILGYLWQNLKEGSFPVALKLAVAAFFLHPFLSGVAQALDDLANPNKSILLSEDAIYAPRLSPTDSKKLVEAIRDLAINKQDIIVFAGDKAEDGGLLYESTQLALNFPNRCLVFDSPELISPVWEQPNPDSFKTSKELRVIFLLHKKHYSDSPEERRSSIMGTWQKRFPKGSSEIHSLPENNLWNFSVHWLDLSASPSKSRASLSP